MALRTLWAAAVAVGVLSIALLAPATGTAAKAKKKTIGSDLKGTPDPTLGYSCGFTADPCAIQQISLPGDPHATRAPFKGTIRKWRFRTTDADNEGYGLRLAVMRKVGAGQSGGGEPVATRFRDVRHSAEKQVEPGPGTSIFKAHLKVKKGDFIALELPYDSDDLINVQGFYVSHPGALTYEWFPFPPPGTSANPFGSTTDFEYFYNATIKKKKKRR